MAAAVNHLDRRSRKPLCHQKRRGGPTWVLLSLNEEHLTLEPFRMKPEVAKRSGFVDLRIEPPKHARRKQARFRARSKFKPLFRVEKVVRSDLEHADAGGFVGGFGFDGPDGNVGHFFGSRALK
jgi:hypothetical protein